VVYGSERRTLSVFENYRRMLKKYSATTEKLYPGMEKTAYHKLNIVYSLPHTVRVKLRNIRWSGHVARIKLSYAYAVLITKREWRITK
jgi:hypothetical protein